MHNEEAKIPGGKYVHQAEMLVKETGSRMIHSHVHLSFGEGTGHLNFL